MFEGACKLLLKSEQRGASAGTYNHAIYMDLYYGKNNLLDIGTGYRIRCWLRR